MPITGEKPLFGFEALGTVAVIVDGSDTPTRAAGTDQSTFRATHRRPPCRDRGRRDQTASPAERAAGRPTPRSSGPAARRTRRRHPGGGHTADTRSGGSWVPTNGGRPDRCTASDLGGSQFPRFASSSSTSHTADGWVYKRSNPHARSESEPFGESETLGCLYSVLTVVVREVDYPRDGLLSWLSCVSTEARAGPMSQHRGPLLIGPER